MVWLHLALLELGWPETLVSPLEAPLVRLQEKQLIKKKANDPSEWKRLVTSSKHPKELRLF